MPSSIDIDPRDASAVHSVRKHAAALYIEQHGDFYLHVDQLLVSCAAELMANHGVLDTEQAHAIAVAALADVQARSHPAWIDISRSTSRVCRLIDPASGKVFTFTAADLVRIAQDLDSEHSGLPPNPQGSRRRRPLHIN